MPRLPVLHDVLIIGSDLPEYEQREAEVIAIDRQQNLYTVYCAADDEFWVLKVHADGTFQRLIVKQEEKEPWEQ